jgi:hypothetical protein
VVQPVVLGLMLPVTAYGVWIWRRRNRALDAYLTEWEEPTSADD